MRVTPMLIACTFGLAVPAQAADCQPEFVETAQTVNVTNLEIGVGEFSRESFSIHVRNTGDGNCSATIRLRRIGAPLAGAPPYTLQSGGNVFEVLTEGAVPTVNSDLPLAVVPEGTMGSEVSFVMTVPSEWGLKAGDYSELIEMSLIDPNGTETDRLNLSLNVNVPQSVALRVVGATGEAQVARIQLGNLSSTAPTVSDPFGVRIWSTSAYRVSIVSENRGQLVHSANLGQVPYQLEFDRRVANLAGADGYLYPQHTSSLGRLHPFSIRVEPVVARAGDYHDRITVTVTAV